MFKTSLARAVERFADVTQGVSDSELDREWAWGAYDSEGVVASIETILDGPLAGIQPYHEALHERVLREFADISEDELAAPSMY